MCRALLPILCLLALVACSEEKISTNGFFPITEEGGETSISAFRAEWYSKHFSVMREEKLFSKVGNQDLEIYRFTLLPTWGDPEAVAVWKKEDGFSIRYRRLDGDGGYDPGQLVEETERRLQAVEVEEFRALFGKLKFSEQATNDSVQGLDGSRWILERLKGGDYHIVDRWTADAYDPQKGGTASFVELCNWMLDHAPKMNVELSTEAD